MYSYEDRVRAVELYLKLGKRVKATIRQLGWDEMLPRVKEVRRFGSPLGLMSFTDPFRERITDVITWGNGPEANSTASSSPDAMAS
ncbi:hypothetical protein K6Y74_37420 [Burkholderia cenocepacia]|jgi:transposase-like protein|uniref:hypothetical protein n=1 Tax=Burkholderia TaxID=32008 RepID=UPI00078BE39A|nr:MULTISPECIES: hypothetical protein [Burkholderia]AMU18510.1 hypothetical protein A3203_35480 [Burkholderia cenocepacia]MBG0875097.1 hypothetical protein [Burkholderia sp. 9777_1386]MCW3588860.1 hypothetical protein [Burkholderia cenocepacia]MCW3633869.1 hypothetical protein [Burkholderia cenocepacia]MCW3648942.1 hypothetical protein [Burkholderia cenocepacia]